MQSWDSRLRLISISITFNGMKLDNQELNRSSLKPVQQSVAIGAGTHPRLTPRERRSRLPLTPTGSTNVLQAYRGKDVVRTFVKEAYLEL